MYLDEPREMGSLFYRFETKGLTRSSCLPKITPLKSDRAMVFNSRTNTHVGV